MADVTRKRRIELQMPIDKKALATTPKEYIWFFHAFELSAPGQSVRHTFPTLRAILAKPRQRTLELEEALHNYHVRQHLRRLNAALKVFCASVPGYLGRVESQGKRNAHRFFEIELAADRKPGHLRALICAYPEKEGQGSSILGLDYWHKVQPPDPEAESSGDLLADYHQYFGTRLDPQSPSAQAARLYLPFAGRDKELDSFRQFANSQQELLLPILGSVGIGKTRFAIECARIVEQEYANWTCFFWQPEHPAELSSLLEGRKPCFILVERATEDTRWAQLLSRHRDGTVKVAVLEQPHKEDQIKEICVRHDLTLRRAPTLLLKPMSSSDLKQMMASMVDYDDRELAMMSTMAEGIPALAVAWADLFRQSPFGRMLKDLASRTRVRLGKAKREDEVFREMMFELATFAARSLMGHSRIVERLSTHSRVTATESFPEDTTTTLKILDVISALGNLEYSDDHIEKLGRAVRLSSAQVTERLALLESNGVITIRDKDITLWPRIVSDQWFFGAYIKTPSPPNVARYREEVLVNFLETHYLRIHETLRSIPELFKDSEPSVLLLFQEYLGALAPLHGRMALDELAKVYHYAMTKHVVPENVPGLTADAMDQLRRHVSSMAEDATSFRKKLPKKQREAIEKLRKTAIGTVGICAVGFLTESERPEFLEQVTLWCREMHPDQHDTVRSFLIESDLKLGNHERGVRAYEAGGERPPLAPRAYADLALAYLECEAIDETERILEEHLQWKKRVQMRGYPLFWSLDGLQKIIEDWRQQHRDIEALYDEARSGEVTEDDSKRFTFQMAHQMQALSTALEFVASEIADNEYPPEMGAELRGYLAVEDRDLGLPTLDLAADLFQRIGLPEDARQCITRSLAREQSVQRFMMLAGTYEEQGRYQDALMCYDRIKEPRMTGYGVESRELFAGTCAVQAGDIRAAARCLSKLGEHAHLTKVLISPDCEYQLFDTIIHRVLNALKKTWPHCTEDIQHVRLMLKTFLWSLLPAIRRAVVERRKWM